MRRIYLIVLIVWVHLGDLLTAWLYAGGEHPWAAWLRHVRDAGVIATAALCLVTTRLPRSILWPLLLYGLCAVAYFPVGWVYGLPVGVLIGSFGTLMIPMLFFLVGYYCIRSRRDAFRAGRWLVIIALASALFGAWDIGHTGFWVDTVHFPAYIAQVKGVLVGTNHESGLPWNFYGGEELARRAAGLLAAPLAQGLFLAVTAVLVLPLLRHRGKWLAYAACLAMLVGVWMSGTRGAMLAGGLALVGYVFTSRSFLRGSAFRFAAAAAVVLGIAVASWGIVRMTIDFSDGSTIGHWHALQENLADIGDVLFVGGGLGRQGAIAAQRGLADLGGGEGAIFTMAYQMGVPAALVFLVFYAAAMRRLWQGHRRHENDLALAVFWVACGVATTLVSSDHILSVSGTAAFWLMAGGLVRIGVVEDALVRERLDAGTPAMER